MSRQMETLLQSRGKPFLRYSLLQVPGTAVLGVLLYMAWTGGWLDAGTAGVIMGFWVFKDVVLYPLYRPALQDTAPTGGRAMVGMEGRAITRIEGRGLVMVRGERWQAVSVDGAGTIAPGTRVRVADAHGLVLNVVPSVREPHGNESGPP